MAKTDGWQIHINPIKKMFIALWEQRERFFHEARQLVPLKCKKFSRDLSLIERVLFAVAIAFCWAYRVGDIRSKEQPIPIKTHGRMAKSLFREGVDLIRWAIFCGSKLKFFRKFLSCFTGLESTGCAV